MKSPLLIFPILFCFTLNISAQYQVKSNNILHPEINIDYVKNNADFWIRNAFDSQYGGFYSSISRTGAVINTTQKSLISQTRHGYGFTRAFMLTGDETYLTYAQSALNFLYNYGWDNVNEGWFTFAKRDGTIDNRVGWNPNATKWGFTQHYSLLGIVANYEATNDLTAKLWIDKGMNVLNNKMWDARLGYEGYYTDASYNWSSKSGKGFTPTVDGVTTHAELLYLITQQNEHKQKFMQLADNIVDRFITSMNDSRVKVLYPEEFTNDWVMVYKTNEGSVGHFVKTAWCLGRAYLCDTTRTQYKNAAIRILNQAWNYQNGSVTIWDRVNGGPFNNINYASGTWGANGDSKDYWTVEQGFTAPMINYYITKNPIYLEMADQSLNFFMTHFIDKVNGEIYSQLDKTGTIIKNDTKGDDFKACYHSIELGYYAYLYSNLYYLHQPASLFYKFAASSTAKSISLSPIPMEEGRLRIKSVTLDGQNFTNFDAVTRTLNLAANQGGKFKVTFESIADAPSAVALVAKSEVAVYPNPTIGIVNVDGVEDANAVSVYDVAGKMLLSNTINGEAIFQINLQQLKSGIYFVHIDMKSGEKMIRKIVKQ